MPRVPIALLSVSPGISCRSGSMSNNGFAGDTPEA